MMPGVSVAGIKVVGRGEARELQREMLGEQVRTVVRYADPAAWITATAVARAAAHLKDQLAGMRERVGVIVVSDHGPAETMEVVAAAAAAGTSSPLRYPAANPGSLAGVTCIVLGFRGPTLNLTMPPAQGVAAGLLMAGAWLRRGAAALMTIAVYRGGAAEGRLARVCVLSLGDSVAMAGEDLNENDAGWLAGDA